MGREEVLRSIERWVESCGEDGRVSGGRETGRLKVSQLIDLAVLLSI